MKNLLLFITLVCMIMSCGRSEEKPGPVQEEIATKRPGGGGGGTANNIPAVTGLTATVVSGTQVNLSWNAVPNATTYWIYRNQYVPAIIAGTTYSDKTLSPGATYTYAIAAVVNSTLGPKSVLITVTTPQ